MAVAGQERVKKEFSSGGVVVRKAGGHFRVLLIKDGYGHWTWPKGHIDRGESSEEAALREIAEETGISEASILSKIGKTQYYHRIKKELIFKTVFLYLVETSQNRVTPLESEIEGVRWFAPKAALKKIEYEGSRRLLKKALLAYARKNRYSTEGYGD